MHRYFSHAIFVVFSCAAACDATSQDLGNNNAPLPEDASASTDPRDRPDSGDQKPAPDGSSSDSPASTPPAFVAGVPFTLVSSNFGIIHGLWGSGASDLWGVGDANGIAHYDGSSWSFFKNPSTAFGSDGYRFTAVSGKSSASAWAVGYVAGAGIIKAQLVKWTGSDWVEPAAKLNNLGEYYLLNGVWAAGEEDVWVVGAGEGSKGFAAHLHGGSWEKLPLDPGGTYYTIWGADADHIFVGAKDRILSYNGSTFVPVSTGLSSMIKAIGGTSATDVWAFGSSGLARHWDGSTWTTTPMGAPLDFNATIARASNDVFAVGTMPGIGSAVAHWNGTAWTRGQVADGAGLYAVWGMNEIWALGNGVIYRGL